MFEKNTETAGRSAKSGYPVRILGRFALRTEEFLRNGTAPTSDQIVEMACKAVKFTQKVNSYPGALITGKHITAAPESGKNGSVFLTLINNGKTHKFLDVLRNNTQDTERVDGVGVYVTSDKRRASATDIDNIGIVLCDENTSRISDTIMDRRSISELPEDHRLQLGEVLTAIAIEADIAYSSKLVQLAR